MLVKVFLKHFTSFHYRFYPLGILLSLAIIGGGAWFSRGLGLDSDIKSLLPQESEIVAQMEKIEPKAGSSNYMLVTLWGGPLETRIAAAKAFSDFVEAKEDFARSVRYQTPKSFLEDKKFMLIALPTLERIRDRLQRERRKHSEITDPFGFEEKIEEVPKTEEEEQASEEAEDREIERAKQLLSDLDEMRPYYASADGLYLSLVIVPETESFSIQVNRELIRTLDQLIKDFDFKSFHPEIEASSHGSIHRQIDKFDAITKDLYSGTWVFVVIFLIVTLYFRTLWAPVMILPPLLVGMFSGFAWVAKVEGSLNTIAIFLVLIVFGVGIDFGAHLFSRYLQERKKLSVAESLYQTWLTTGRATITSSIALMAGFGLLSISSFEGFAQFGRVAVLLLSLAALSFLVLMPSWICFVEKLRKSRPWGLSLSDVSWEKSQGWYSPRVLKITKALRISTLILVPICIVTGILFVRFDYAFQEGVKPPARLPSSYQGDSFSERLKPSAIAVFKDSAQAARFVESFQVQADQYPDIAMVNGLSSFLPEDLEDRIFTLQEIADEIEPSLLRRFEDEEIKEALLEIQETAYDLETYEIDALPADLREFFLASDGSNDQLVYLFDIGGATDGRKAILFSSAVEEFVSANDFEVEYSGHEILFADIVKRVTTEGPLLVLGMLFLVFLICWLDFRNLRDAVLTMSPVILGFLFTGLFLSLFQIKLNFFNMAALASLGSLVVDNSIHLYHRYCGLREEGHPNPYWGATLAVGPTVTTCTFTSTTAYWALLVSDHSGISSLGAVAVIGLLCCLVSAVIFFPAWLERADSRRTAPSNKS
jgi:predicted RND superfamily exporter protein